MGERLTDRLVKTLPVPASGSKITYDTEVKGFAARVTAAGARAFIVRYRIAGQGRLFTIGSFPDWSTSAARDEARAMKRRVDQDKDPMGERHQKRAEPTIDDLCDRYLSEHVIPHNKPSTAREVRRLVDAQIRPGQAEDLGDQPREGQGVALGTIGDANACKPGAGGLIQADEPRRSRLGAVR
jgi:Arm DNA-binding domain